jgi:hypothetical protein
VAIGHVRDIGHVWDIGHIGDIRHVGDIGRVGDIGHVTTGCSIRRWKVTRHTVGTVEHVMVQGTAGTTG